LPFNAKKRPYAFGRLLFYYKIIFLASYLQPFAQKDTKFNHF
jgi:hypothetical protein